MATSPARNATDETQASIGGLVANAMSDVSALIKYEVDLARMELKTDVRKLGMGAALMGVAGFVLCLILVLLCFAYAFGLVAVGAPGGVWGAFLWVALTCFVLAVVAVVIGYFKFRHLSGLRRTRRTVSDDIAMIRREDTSANGSGTAR